MNRLAVISQRFILLRPRGPAAALFMLLGAGFGFGDCGRTTPLQCQKDVDCPQSSQCDLQGRCTPKIAECATDRECGMYYRCEQFDCVPLDACLSDADCERPERCLRERPGDHHGHCQRSHQCPQACPAQHYCGADLRCIPQGACGSDGDCGEEKVCDHGRCIEALCEEDNDCLQPRRCGETGLCELPVRCIFDQDCPRAQHCVEKLCQSPAQRCQDCPTGTICVQHRCLPAAGGVAKQAPLGL